MAESQGTWVKLGEQSWQFIPCRIKQMAYELGLTWETAATIARPLNSAVEPSGEAVKALGMYHAQNRVSLKPRDATKDSIEFVEISPRRASTAKVCESAIKLIPAADVEMPPGNFHPPSTFGAHIDTPPGNFSRPASSRWNTTPKIPINHGEEEGEQTTKSVPGVNSWWSAHDIAMYLSNEKPGALMWNPCNAYIFDSITDFVSTLRAEASMPGAHFKWPEQRMTYEMIIAQAIHHLPPGYQVSIRNGNPCPEGLTSTPEWTGETTEYYHGTTAHNLLRGIIRDGLKPTYGAGADATEAAWGMKTPMVYLSKNIESAS